MPTYEYACSQCGHAWEEVQRITESPVEVCPSCKTKSAHRQISGGNFILKGGGWYADLYSSAKPAAKKEEGAPAAKADTKSDAPAAKTPSTAPAAAPATTASSSTGSASGGSASGGSASKE